MFVLLVLQTVILVLPTAMLVPFVEEALSARSTGPAKQYCVNSVNRVVGRIDVAADLFRRHVERFGR